MTTLEQLKRFADAIDAVADDLEVLYDIVLQVQAEAQVEAAKLQPKAK